MCFVRRESRYENQNHYHQPPVWKRRAYNRKNRGPAAGHPLLRRGADPGHRPEERFLGKLYPGCGRIYTGGLFSSTFSDRSFGPTNEDRLWVIRYGIISELAQEGPCVIVGRCADFILRDKADCLRVFVHADMDFRAERIVREYGEREASAQQRLRDKDKRRAAYYRFYTDMKWGDALNYSITLNSGELGLERCAQIILELY